MPEVLFARHEETVEPGGLTVWTWDAQPPGTQVIGMWTEVVDGPPYRGGCNPRNLNADGYRLPNDYPTSEPGFTVGPIVFEFTNYGGPDDPPVTIVAHWQYADATGETAV